jgi:predicted nucleic acid-binding protein
MIIVDTSIWIDHLHRGDDAMRGLLESEAVLMHPFVLGEIALGSLNERRQVLGALKAMPMAPLGTSEEVFELVERHELHGSGIGLVDAHLLASALLDGRNRLWTRDKRLGRVAERLAVNAESA